jgi:hypothetical protein
MAEYRALGAIVPVAAPIDYSPAVLSCKPFAIARLNIWQYIWQSVTRQVFPPDFACPGLLPASSRQMR